MAVQQLRLYRINPAMREPFHRRFRDHAMRIMATYGFEFIGLWESEGEDALEFVYLLQWPDLETLERQWAKFMANEEWEAVKQRVRAEIGGEPVLEVTSKVLTPVGYGPNLGASTKRD